jgi:hypothetical protein
MPPHRALRFPFRLASSHKLSDKVTYDDAASLGVEISILTGISDTVHMAKWLTMPPHRTLWFPFRLASQILCTFGKMTYDAASLGIEIPFRLASSHKWQDYLRCRLIRHWDFHFDWHLRYCTCGKMTYDAASLGIEIPFRLASSHKWQDYLRCRLIGRWDFHSQCSVPGLLTRLCQGILYRYFNLNYWYRSGETTQLYWIEILYIFRQSVIYSH